MHQAKSSRTAANRVDVSVEQIAEAGERALVVIYGGKVTDNLNSLRYKKLCEKTASKVLTFCLRACHQRQHQQDITA